MKGTHLNALIRTNSSLVALILTLSIGIGGNLSGNTVSYDTNGNLTQIRPPGVSKPLILSQPADWTGVSGSIALFAVRTVDSANAYQWKKGVDAIPGATAESLVISNVSAADEGLYSVVVSNSNGSVTSRQARLGLDTDGDGMADWQENEVFGNLAETGTDDFDKDGISNAEELVDGTDPTERTSRHYRLVVAGEHGTVTVTPASPTGRYAPNTKVSLTPRAEAGYQFQGWLGTVDSLIPTLSLTMNRDVAETALFASDLGVALNAPDLPWQTGGVSGAWIAQRELTQDGRAAAKSAGVSADGSSWVSTYVQGPATISFWWMQPTGSTGVLQVSVDGTAAQTATPDGNWAQSFVSVNRGVHLLSWQVSQITGATEDAVAFLDRVSVEDSNEVPLGLALEAPQLNWATDRMNPWVGFASPTVSQDGIDAARTVLNGQYKSTWIETTVNGTGTLTFWWRETGTQLRLLVDGVEELAAGTGWSQATIELTLPGPHFLRWEADTNYDTYADVEFGTAFLDQVTWNPPKKGTPTVAVPVYSISQAVGGTLAWQTGGKKHWKVVTDVFQSSPASLASGDIGRNGESWIETRVTGPGNLNFYWSVDSEAGKDLFTVSLDGTVANTISGDVSWQFQTLAIPQGPHTVRWRYSKNGSGDVEPDRAGLDSVVFTATNPQIPTTPPALGGSPVTSIADAVDNTSLSFFSGGSAVCTVDTATTHDSVDAMKSGTIGNSSETWFETILSGTGNLSFWWKVSSEGSYDFLRLEIDGVQRDAISGGVDWMQKTVAITTAGLHKVRWRYSKDGSAVSGSDAGWVDQVEWTGNSGGIGGGLAAYPANIFAPPTASTQTINVVGTGAWTATENLSWVEITSPTNGTNAGTVTLAIKANDGAPREGSITVAGQEVIIGQDSVRVPVVGLLAAEVKLAVGQNFSTSIRAYNSPTSFTAKGLPPGIQMNATTGALSGIATSPGTFTAAITGKNSAGRGVSAKLKFVISPKQYRVAVGRSFSPALTFPHGPNSFSAKGLPVGLSINSSTGLISGVPSKAGNYNVTINGTNAAKLDIPLRFTVEVFMPTFAGGTYSGTIGANAEINDDFGGLATFKVSVSGAVTGALRLGAKRLALKGNVVMDANGGATITALVKRAGGSPLNLAIALDPGRYFGFGEGTLTDSAAPSKSAAMRVWTNVWNRSNPATAFVGKFTNTLSPPANALGDASVPQGWGLVSWDVKPNGTVKWNGTTADGEPHTGSSALWPTGEFPLFAMLYRDSGALVGLPVIAADRHCSGRIDWLKKTQSSGTRYPDGFGPLALSLEGGEYHPPARTEYATGLSETSGNGELRIAMSDIESSTDIQQPFRVALSSKAFLPSGSVVSSLRLDLKRGSYFGVFAAGDRSGFFSGLLLDGVNEGRGFFLLPNLGRSTILSGRVQLTPSP